MDTYLGMAGGAISGAMLGHGIEKGIIAAREHKSPTGIEAIDKPETRQIVKEMKAEQYGDLSPNLERHSWILERNGEIGHVPGKPGYNSAQPASLPVSERVNVIADIHGPRPGGSLTKTHLSWDLKYSFPQNDIYLGKKVPRLVYDSKDIIVFEKGIYNYELGKIYTQEYYFRTFLQRYIYHLLRW